MLRSGLAHTEAAGRRARLLGADAHRLASPGRGRSRRARRCPVERRAGTPARARAREQAPAPGARAPAPGGGVLRQGERSNPMRFRFTDEQAAQYPVSLLCRAMGIPRAGDYAWRDRGPSARTVADAALVARITQIHDATLGIYGAPRIHAELRIAHGIRVGKKRVARLMRARHLRCRPTRRAHNDRPRCQASFGTRSGRSRIRPQRTEAAVGVRHQIGPNGPGVPVSGRRAGRVFAQDRRLVDAR